MTPATFYYFTGTGNTLHLARGIAERFPGAELVSIAALDPSARVRCESEIVGIFYPTYFLDAPRPVHDFLDRLEVPRDSYVFLYANWGGIGGNALSRPDARLKTRGIRARGFYSVEMPDNSIIFPTTPVKAKLMLEAAEEAVRTDRDAIASRREIPAPRPTRAGAVVGSLTSRWCEGVLGFRDIRADAGKCDGCGLCSRVCSVGNLRMDGGRPVAGDKCAMCFACIHYCPRQAIRFRRMRVRAGKPWQIVNPHVKVRDIIASRA